MLLCLLYSKYPLTVQYIYCVRNFLLSTILCSTSVYCTVLYASCEHAHIMQVRCGGGQHRPAAVPRARTRRPPRT